MNYDIIVIGSGPGGYVAAIRASQLGKKVALIEKESLGGICLNWGCIPTKALLRSAEVYSLMKRSQNFGIQCNDITIDFEAIINRSRTISANMSRGIQFLIKKYNVDLLTGYATLHPDKKVVVKQEDGNSVEVKADHIIIATGARSRELPNLKQDGKYIIGYREALSLRELPKSMIVIGSGAIGSELASFYNSMGTSVTLVEYLPNVVPLEDEEVSKQAERSMKKAGISVLTNSGVDKVTIKENRCIVTINSQKKGLLEKECDIVLSAVGVTPNIENIGLEQVGIKTENGKIVVDDFYQTNISGYYAIGDTIPGPALAHVASHEAIICVEKISGEDPTPMNYKQIPACTYITPEIASCGLSEAKAIAAGYEIKVGKFPFTASGKATTAEMKEGFVKLIFDAKNNKLIGAHLIGDHVTEMISSLVLAMKSDATAEDLTATVHPHPTMSEAIMEAAAGAIHACVHL